MLITCLWASSNNALEMAEFYCSVFPRSEITFRAYHDEPNQYNPDIKAGDVMLVEFTLLGEDKFMTLNGGPMFQPSCAASWVITCADQAELDHYYTHLSAKAESEVCGWIQDKFGISWQLVPKNYTDYIMHGERSKIINMNRKVLGMKRLSWDAIEQAYHG